MVSQLFDFLGDGHRQLLVSGRPDPVAGENVLEHRRQRQHGQPRNLHRCSTFYQKLQASWAILDTT